MLGDIIGMNISPSSVSIPTVAPSVNPPTEQVARDNRIREKITPTKQAFANTQEQPLKQEEKQFKKPAWDPFEHPNYSSLTQKSKAFSGSEFTADNDFHLNDALYSKDYENGYSMKMKLPKEVLDKLETMRSYRRTGAVVAMRYEQSSVANIPSEVLIII